MEASLRSEFDSYQSIIRRGLTRYVQACSHSSIKIFGWRSWRRVIVLIDEYDTPISSASEYGYFTQVGYFFADHFFLPDCHPPGEWLLLAWSLLKVVSIYAWFPSTLQPTMPSYLFQGDTSSEMGILVGSRHLGNRVGIQGGWTMRLCIYWSLCLTDPVLTTGQMYSLDKPSSI